jgi:hypothetical protein
MLFVRMLIIILQRMSKSIQPKEACLPVITVVSPVTFDPNIHSSRSQRFRGSCQQDLHHALYLRWLLGSTTSAEVYSYQTKWQTKEEQIKALQEKAAEAQW